MLVSAAINISIYIPIETQDFSEDKDQHHANEDPGLLHVGSNTTIAHDSDAVAGRKTSHTHSDSTAKMQERSVQISPLSQLLFRKMTYVNKL